MKIFLVDDDSFCLNIYRQHLINIGYTDIALFAIGTDCINSLTQQPDVIFLDHGLEILNGIEVLKKIKRFNPDIYVVFISGQENIETAVTSLKYGAFDYIVKDGKELEKITDVLVKIQKVQQLLESSRPSLIKRFLSPL